MRNLKYLLSDDFKHKARVNQLDFIEALKHRVFVKLDSMYGEYLPEYANYFGKPLRLNKSIYGMTHCGKLFADKLTNFLIDESGFNHSKCQMSVY